MSPSPIQAYDVGIMDVQAVRSDVGNLHGKGVGPGWEYGKNGRRGLWTSPTRKMVFR